ncbi:MAG: hypothetical protein Q9165_001253 [Trypethelium subeluteriae]
MAHQVVFPQPYDPPQPYYSEGLRERFHVEDETAPADEGNPQSFANIQYEPNKAEYQAKTQARMRAGGLNKTLPDGFPQALSGPLVWDGSVVLSGKQFIHRLTETDQNEIEQGLSNGLEGDKVSKDNFPLPNLGQQLEELRDQVYRGRGLAIVRGLEPQKYSATDLVVVYLGISSYIAERRGKQDQQGSTLVHINDTDTEPGERDLSKQQVFLNFSRRLLTGHPHSPRTEGIPGLTEAQAEALDAVHFIAHRHQFKMAMEAGDLRFINNMAILHCREAFQDDDSSKRHLIRLWLNNEEMCWKLPPHLELAWARVFEDEERGRHWDVEPPLTRGRKRADSCD